MFETICAELHAQMRTRDVANIIKNLEFATNWGTNCSSDYLLF